MKIKTLALLTSVLGCSAVMAAEGSWQALTFGQSTDLNFSSNVLPTKVGVNQVQLKEDGPAIKPGVSGPLYPSFLIESRGGKLANSHDGMTVYYSQIPADRAFVLEADMTILQLGPENGKTPNAQEGAGLFVRDSLGHGRLMPQPTGFEEFPHASNMLLNAALTTNKANDNLVNLVSVQRGGVAQPWGNKGVAIERKPYEKGVDFSKTTFHLKLERNADGFLLSWYDQAGKLHAQQQTPDRPDFLTTQDENAFVGFFASRNAKARFDNAKLTLGDTIKDGKQAAALKAKQDAAALELASAATNVGGSYLLQLRPNYDGVVSLDGKDHPAQGGEFLQLPVALKNGDNALKVTFTANEGPSAGKAVEQTFTITQQAATVADTRAIHVAPAGVAGNNGTEASPVDLATALAQLQPGGTIWLADGEYQGFELTAAQSGLPAEPKRLQAVNRHKAVFTKTTSVLNASYWTLDGLVFDGNPDGSLKSNNPAFLRVAGSHNRLERLVARNNADTGIWITANGVYTSPSLWPSHNLVLNSDSYNNRDDSGINADGFAAKLGVGAGNLFDGCLAYNNADDGWDLFNKIEDGPNQPVTIVNSVAYRNGLPFGHKAPAGTIGNGFKLGGEGQPVAHVVKNSQAIANNMDGFTDNFNTGALDLQGNVAVDNARYNYIVRSNPYPKSKVSVHFDSNHSLRSDAHKLADYLGNQVEVKKEKAFAAQEKALRQEWLKRSTELSFSRDDAGVLTIKPANAS